MKTSAKSLLVFGVYLVGIGIGFVLMPNLLLGMLGLPPTAEVWSRVVGMFALLLAFYYIQAARANLQPFIQWTVYTRIAAFFFFTAFVIAGLAGPVLILLGSVDMLAAAWTEWAIRKEKRTSFSELRPAASQPTPKIQP